ncbi:MAG: RNA chaperone Hfq [Faecousia sp.]
MDEIEIKILEEVVLSEAAENGSPVRIVFTNGYQTTAVIKDFDCETILAEVKGKRWMIYRHAVSTVVLD